MIKEKDLSKKSRPYLGMAIFSFFIAGVALVLFILRLFFVKEEPIIGTFLGFGGISNILIGLSACLSGFSFLKQSREPE
ncbi:hypothetical protein [Litoribacter populi]|uniref:hypothetical protein n=1 Tax=Litoribacter populi TaxID=2598460 RepID=UPI00117D1FD8|nr:hypothetical protein [Litoribacter populi]